MEVNPGTSFFDFGEYREHIDVSNPWEQGTKMAPFDKEVSLETITLCTINRDGSRRSFFSTTCICLEICSVQGIRLHWTRFTEIAVVLNTH